nr:ribonuclease H-like domain-containing protein [Tanacetum cinerariifolium]
MVTSGSGGGPVVVRHGGGRMATLTKMVVTTVVVLYGGGGCFDGGDGGAKKEWGLSPKANVRVLHNAKLDVTFGFPIASTAQPINPAQPISHQAHMSFAVPYIALPGSTVPTATPGQATTLPHAFTAGTVYDPALTAWNMDTESDVLRRLVSNNFISCIKEKPPDLCHACQLAHVRLPFVSSDTIITSCLDFIYSDVWTSPIPSLSGFKYYVLFWDHYSHLFGLIL